VDPRFRYQLGDLVELKRTTRVTEEYVDVEKLTGIVIEQRWVFTADNKFKVRTPEKDYWIRADHLTLLSSGSK
jgi:hypothetical protein